MLKGGTDGICRGDPDVDNTVVDMAVCFLSCGHTEKAQRGVPRIDRSRRLGSSPGLSSHIYKVGKIIPTVATSQVI